MHFHVRRASILIYFLRATTAPPLAKAVSWPRPNWRNSLWQRCRRERRSRRLRECEFFLNLYVLPTYGGPASILFTTMRRKRNSSSRCHGSVTRPKGSISQFPRISLTKPSKQRRMPLRRSNKCIFGIVMYSSLKLHAMKTNIKLVLNYTICSNSRA